MIWMGAIAPPESFTQKYGVDETKYVDELPEFLLKYNDDQPPATIHTLYGVNSDTGDSGLPLPDFEGHAEKLESVSTTAVAAARRGEPRDQVRRGGAPRQRVNDIASDAHMEVMRGAKPGMFEFQLESLFLHHCYYIGGCRMAAYTAICGCGPQGATLHYGHAGAPNDQQVKDGDMLLLDMGTSCAATAATSPARSLAAPAASSRPTSAWSSTR